MRGLAGVWSGIVAVLPVACVLKAGTDSTIGVTNIASGSAVILLFGKLIGVESDAPGSLLESGTDARSKSRMGTGGCC